MAQLVERTPQLRLLATLASAEEAQDWLTQNSADLVFLDIEMPGISGMDLAVLLQGDTRVIFTTAYSEYAVQSYDVEAIDYLLKPITPSRFAKAVERALAAIPQDDTITIRTNRHNLRLHPSEIIYIEGMKDYVKIHCQDRRIISRLTIKAILDMLPAADFVRIHKSYIVNLKFITAFDFSTVEIAIPGTASSVGTPLAILPLGASYRNEFENKCR